MCDSLLICGITFWLAGLSADVGPRLSEHDFFNGLDLGLPGLEQVKEAVANEDWATAKSAFAQYFRSRETPRWFIDWREKPQPQTPRPNTDNADKAMDHQWRWQSRWFDLGERIDWSSNQMTEGESATVEWNASLNRHFHFSALADAYVNTGEDKYAAEIVAQMLGWIEDCPMLLDASGNSPYHYAWETLNTAVRAGDTWPNALYKILASPAVTDDALCLILRSLVEQARHLDRWPTRTGNWLTAESKAVYIVGVLLPEFQDAATWRKNGIDRLYMQLREQVYPDGLEYELAIGYNNWVLRNFAEVLELAKLNGRMDELPEDYLSLMESMYDYQAYASMPNGIVPGLNDANGASPVRYLRQGYKYFPHRKDFLWVATRGEEGEIPDRTSVSFPYSGHYVTRSGWDEDARYLLFDAGPFGSGHQHEDKLHVILHAYGRQLLLDAGNYMYDHSRWRRYVLSTRGHNTIRVDGQDQNHRRARETWISPMPFQPLDNVWVSEPDFDYAVGRYQAGYGKDRAIKVEHTRAILFVKPDYWLIVDTLQSQDDEEHEYESLFHLGAEEAVIDEASKVVITQNSDANLALYPLITEDLAVEVVKGVEDEPVQGWAGSPWRPVPTAIFRRSGAGITRLVTMIYPLSKDARLPVESVEMLPVTDAVAFQIRFTDGRTHVFLYADKGGLKRRYGQFETDAAVEFTKLDPDGKSVGVFRYMP